jgi:hypothetical protein
MKVMFLDESGDHSLSKIDKSYPMFVLAGCIFDFDYYSKTVEPEINKLKLKYFNKTEVILRSYDIRKQKGEFSCLVDRKKRDEFTSDLNQIMTGLNFHIIAAAINKNELKNQYSAPSNPYHLCLEFILERSIMYLGRSGEQMILRIESRETHNDQILAEVYEKFRNNDHQLFKMTEIQSKLVDLSFNQKTQNIVGMQFADLVAYPIGRKVLDDQKENIPFDIIKPKFHQKNGEILNYGLKCFPYKKVGPGKP